MAAIIDDAQFWSAFTSWNAWGARGNLASNAFPTGFSNVSSPAHPFASTLGERYIKVDGSGSHEMRFVCAYHDETVAPPPATANRWAHVLTQLFQLGTTAPTSKALLFTFSNTVKLWLNTDGLTFELDVNGSTSTSGVAAATATDYQLEAWQVITDAAGVALTSEQFVVRLVSGLGGALVTTEVINVEKTPSFLGVGADLVVGETTARGAGFEWYFANIAKTMQDADAPWGIHRIDRLTPDGIGHLDEWPFTAAAADLDESGAGAPDDGTTEDTVSITNAAAKTGLTTLTAPAYAVSADAILGLMGFLRGWQTAGAKGTTSTVQEVISDGTNDELAAAVGGTDAYWNAVVAYKYTPTTTTKWVHGDLAGLQFGVKASTTSPGALTEKISTLTMLVLYRKDGETTPAVPAVPAAGQRRRAAVVG